VAAAASQVRALRACAGQRYQGMRYQGVGQ